MDSGTAQLSVSQLLYHFAAWAFLATARRVIPDRFRTSISNALRRLRGKGRMETV